MQIKQISIRRELNIGNDENIVVEMVADIFPWEDVDVESGTLDVRVRNTLAKLKHLEVNPPGDNF